VLSHGSAARLHGLGDLVNDTITITVPRRRLVRDDTVTVRWLQKRPLSENDVTLVDGLPVTTALRTIVDLLDDHIDASHAATIIRQAVHAGMTELDVLADALGPYARRYGVQGRDGNALLNHLLGHIGTSVAVLAERPARENSLARLLSGANANQTRALLNRNIVDALGGTSKTAVLSGLGVHPGLQQLLGMPNLTSYLETMNSGNLADIAHLAGRGQLSELLNTARVSPFQGVLGDAILKAASASTAAEPEGDDDSDGESVPRPESPDLGRDRSREEGRPE
jgi:hypothetical protein